MLFFLLAYKLIKNKRVSYLTRTPISKQIEGIQVIKTDADKSYGKLLSAVCFFDSYT